MTDFLHVILEPMAELVSSAKRRQFVEMNSWQNFQKMYLRLDCLIESEYYI